MAQNQETRNIGSDQFTIEFRVLEKEALGLESYVLLFFSYFCETYYSDGWIVTHFLFSPAPSVLVLSLVQSTDCLGRQ
jgi:hypothetical protein